MSLSTFELSKKKILAIINALLPDAKVYLYGSRARGTASEWSDIDLALDLEKQIPSGIVGELNDVMVALNIPYKVDIVDIYCVSDSMKTAILRDKVIWKS